MFSMTCIRNSSRSAQFCAFLLTFSLLVGVLAIAAISAVGQDSPSSSASQNPNQQDVPPEAGGPNGNTGPYAIPKKGEEPPPPPP